MKTFIKTLSCLFLLGSLLLHTPSFFPVFADNTPVDPAKATEYETFIKDVIFFGESTTSHLKSRGVLPGGTETKQVVSSKAGTMRLNSSSTSRLVIDPVTGEELPAKEVFRRLSPKILVLSFGLNGITDFTERKEIYLSAYEKLLNCIREVSPKTRIVIQSIYPVAKDEKQIDWKFSVSPKEINDKILELNTALSAFCKEKNVSYLDTASVLFDENGFLNAKFTTDGIHLNENAYRKILGYLFDRRDQIL